MNSHRLLLTAVVACAAFCLTAIPAEAINIIWVTENTDGSNAPSPDDVGFTDFLSAQGHTVVRRDNRVLDGAKIAEMNGADLVIVSRDTNSGNYVNGSEVADWNGVTTPLIQMNQFITRNSRWRWVNNGGTPGNGDGEYDILDPSHPLFGGIASDPVDVATSNSPAITLDAANNGVVLATDDDNANGTAVFWAAGTEFFTGSGQIAGGDRLFLGMGFNSNNPKGAFNLTADGETILLNAVNFLAPAVPEPTTAMLGMLGLAGLAARRRRAA